MPITVISGRPGAGKSLMLSQRLLDVLKRNVKWCNKTGILRKVYTNLHLNTELETEYSEYIRFWKKTEELYKIQDADVFIDEIANYFDSNDWKELSPDVKRWLQQHRKLGVEIYGNAQDFSQVDIAFRRMTSDLFYLVKLISSRDPSPTTPAVKYIWGISIIYKMSPVDYKEDQKENKATFNSLTLITKNKTEIFNPRTSSCSLFLNSFSFAKTSLQVILNFFLSKIFLICSIFDLFY